MIFLGAGIWGQDNLGDPYVTVSNDTVTFGIDAMNRNCAALFIMDVQLEENVFMVAAIDTSYSQAYCWCTFDITVDINSVPSGDYMVQFYSYDYDGYDGLDTLFIGELSFTVEWGGGDGLVILSGIQSPCGGFIYGCTDPDAVNYNPDAILDDGSCIYEFSTIYVSTGGSDATGDGSEDNPFATIQHGLNNASEGDTVLVASGSYYENIIWPNINGIKLIGSGQEDCIINGSRLSSVIQLSSSWPEIDSTTVIENLTVKNGEYGDGGGIRCWGASPTIKDVIITENYASYGGGVSIDLYSHPIFKNVAVVNNYATGGGGIYICCASYPIFINSTIAGNHASWGGGMYTVHNYSHIRFINCIFWNESEYEIITEGTRGYIMFDYSLVRNGMDGIYTDSDPSIISWLEGNIDVDPLFTDYENGDFTLQSNSPCIDAGTTLLIFEGDTLINMTEDEYYGAAPDMGAFEYDGSAGVEPEYLMPTKYTLHQNYPNPFNPTTTISYDVPNESYITITIYDLMGRRVNELMSKRVSAGKHTVIWNGTDANNNPVASGMYLYQLKSGDFVETRKLLLLK